MLAAKINNNSKHNNKSKRVLCKIQTKKSPNSNLLDLITLQGHKVMQFRESVRITIILVWITKGLVLYEGGKTLPSDAY